ncbi:hypothetical protein HME9302_01263 [Alteripontixanthobacter maritimus]|uniref:MobA-like NTP transferase domain-containing protein n=1 Tax=Alteripontixanthobacter maritimus TaxID=2161824 RepID=A0A369Q5R4_9SPHN|nr:nucleotidyltransferase family protein [Alteripontixanthobacter maritimus]RDC60064.1 hypothetical protein HME9302_01263 [Alteripontixanthobacter maritimus]
MSGFAALILAGTRPGGDPFAREIGVLHKGLIEVGGIPMLERVITALQGAGANRIAVSCDDGAVADLARRTGCDVVATEAGPSQSALAALDIIGAPLVITTADHALLQPEWVQQLVADTSANADVSVMLARQEDVERAAPGTRRTYLGFADGRWSGCNLFYIASPRGRAALELWRHVEANRKRPWRIVARLGLPTLFAYLTRRLTMADGLARLGKRIGIAVALVRAVEGHAAIDVDKQADLLLAEKLLAAREAGAEAGPP